MYLYLLLERKLERNYKITDDIICSDYNNETKEFYKNKVNNNRDDLEKENEKIRIEIAKIIANKAKKYVEDEIYELKKKN